MKKFMFFFGIAIALMALFSSTGRYLNTREQERINKEMHEGIELGKEYGMLRYKKAVLIYRKTSKESIDTDVIDSIYNSEK